MNSSSLRSVRPILAPAALTLLALGFALTGCGKLGRTGPNLVPLSLKGGGTGVSTISALGAAGTSATSTESHDVVVSFTTALLNVRDVRFKLSFEGEEDTTGTGDDGLGGFAGEAAATDSLDMEDDGGEGMIIFRGPFLIDLLANSAAELDEKLVPPGMYRRVQGHLQALHEGDAAAAGRSLLIGSTVLLEGTISGEGGGPFTYRARIDDEFQIRGAFAVVEDTPATAFITFDLSRWLLDGEGHLLDPRDPLNDQAIKSAIRHSIKVEMGEDE